MTHHVHPSLLRCRRPPPAASGPAAAASPSCAIEVARPASFWPRRGLPRSENEPGPDSEIDVRFDAPDAARRSPNYPAGPSANHPNIDTTIKWAGGVRKSPSSSGEYSTIRNELQFGRYFAVSAGGDAAAQPQMDMQQYHIPRCIVYHGRSEFAWEGGMGIALSLHCNRIGSECGISGHSGSTASAALFRLFLPKI